MKSKTPNIQAVFLDLDGTLLSSDLTISAKNYSALQRVHQEGIKIFIASGRPADSIEEIVHGIESEPFVIALNGSCIVNTISVEVLFHQAIYESTVDRVHKLPAIMG